MSEKPRSGSDVLRQARAVLGVLESIGVDEAHLVGHSAGGDIVASTLEQAASRVRSATFIGATPHLGFVSLARPHVSCVCRSSGHCCGGALRTACSATGSRRCSRLIFQLWRTSTFTRCAGCPTTPTHRGSWHSRLTRTNAICARVRQRSSSRSSSCSAGVTPGSLPTQRTSGAQSGRPRGAHRSIGHTHMAEPQNRLRGSSSIL
jgi:pimeloyl-ACP methyl ester carboxylesterase